MFDGEGYLIIKLNDRIKQSLSFIIKTDQENAFICDIQFLNIKMILKEGNLYLISEDNIYRSSFDVLEYNIIEIIIQGNKFIMKRNGGENIGGNFPPNNESHHIIFGQSSSSDDPPPLIGEIKDMFTDNK